jgi:DNA-binding NarL/FixJ family response regulator
MRVLLADLEGPSRRALATLLRDIDGVQLVGEAGERGDVASALRRAQPDVIVIDERLLKAGTHVLAGLGPMPEGVRVIVLSVDDDPAFAARARRLGASAWVAKERADEDLPALLVSS